jgi:hypothetical protein
MRFQIVFLLAPGRLSRSSVFQESSGEAYRQLGNAVSKGGNNEKLKMFHIHWGVLNHRSSQAHPPFASTNDFGVELPDKI